MLFHFNLKKFFYSISLLINISFSLQECIKGKNYCSECSTSSHICQKCTNNSLYPDLNGGCSSTKNCLISNDGICLKCDKNFYLSDDKICSSTNFCLKTNNINSKCIICKPGYILTINDECSLTKNCLSANPKTGMCIKCEQNFYYDLDKYECKSNLENNKFNFCLKSLKNNCIECLPYFYLGLDNQCSISKNCKISENGICTSCFMGYYLSLLDKKCTNTENCLKVNDSNEECEECKEEYFYDYSLHKCILRDIKKNNDIKNCLSVTSNNNCYKCKNNYYLNMTDFSCYINNIRNNKFYKCAKTDINAEYCEECVSDYYLSSINKRCSDKFGCAYYFDNKCLMCEDYLCHDLRADLCLPKNISSYFDYKEFNKFCINCYQTTKEGTGCSICDEGFFVGENGVCINTEYCDEAFNGKCLKCKDNYCLNEKQVCLSTDTNNCLKCENEDIYYSKCTECAPGFILNEHNICLKCENGCKSCTDENNCLECFIGFYLVNENGKFTCKECDKSCRHCINENECLTCNDNYYKENEGGEIKCVKCPEGCEDCIDKSICIKCKKHYKLINEHGYFYCMRIKKK